MTAYPPKPRGSDTGAGVAVGVGVGDEDGVEIGVEVSGVTTDVDVSEITVLVSEVVGLFIGDTREALIVVKLLLEVKLEPAFDPETVNW
jgi:hypothetical protein